MFFGRFQHYSDFLGRFIDVAQGALQRAGFDFAFFLAGRRARNGFRGYTAPEHHVDVGDFVFAFRFAGVVLFGAFHRDRSEVAFFSTFCFAVFARGPDAFFFGGALPGLGRQHPTTADAFARERDVRAFAFRDAFFGDLAGFEQFEAAGAFRFGFRFAVRFGVVAARFGFALGPFEGGSARGSDRRDREGGDQARREHPYMSHT